MTWKLEEAKSRLEEVLDSSLREGPQIVSWGEAEFIVLSREEWTSLGGGVGERSKLESINREGKGIPGEACSDASTEVPPERMTLKAWLLSGPKCEDMMIPDRHRWRFRDPAEF